MNRFADVVVDSSALPHGLYDRSKIVVHQHHIGRILRDIRSVFSHCAADIRRFQRRRVVDPVSGHRDDFPRPLQRTDDPHLVLRRDAGKYTVAAYIPIQLLLRHPIQLRPGHSLFPVLQYADFRRDCTGGSNMVAGNHDRRDSCLAAGAHARRSLLARRIDHADQTEEYKPLLRPAA